MSVVAACTDPPIRKQALDLSPPYFPLAAAIGLTEEEEEEEAGLTTVGGGGRQGGGKGGRVKK